MHLFWTFHLPFGRQSSRELEPITGRSREAQQRNVKLRFRPLVCLFLKERTWSSSAEQIAILSCNRLNLFSPVVKNESKEDNLHGKTPSRDLSVRLQHMWLCTKMQSCSPFFPPPLINMCSLYFLAVLPGYWLGGNPKNQRPAGSNHRSVLSKFLGSRLQAGRPLPCC